MVNVTLPKGLPANSPGSPTAPRLASAAAAAKAAKPSWPARAVRRQARSGSATTAAGSGSGPIKIDGKAYLAGPYKGAPLSMAVITPAVAGPYDLGTVVVRVALNVNPETAAGNRRLRSDPRHLRRGQVGHPLDRHQCRPQRVHAQPDQLRRPGDERCDQRWWRQPGQSGRLQRLPGQRARMWSTDCTALSFKPKLFTRLSGPTKRGKNPRIRAILEARKAMPTSVARR